MAILLPTEQKSTKGRLIHAGIVALLLLGGVTMVYPFLVMLSGSVRSAVDESELDLLPDYLVEDEALYRKFLEFKYNGDINALNRAHREAYFSFAEVSPPQASEFGLPHPDSSNQNFFEFVLGGTQANKAVPGNLRRIREKLVERFGGDLMAYVDAGGDPTPSWLTVVMPPPRWFDRRYDHPTGPIFDAYLEVAQERPPAERQPLSITGHFLETMVFPTFGRDEAALAAFSEIVGRPLERWSHFALHHALAATPTSEGFHRLWIDYLRQELNPTFITVNGGPGEDVKAEWHRFLHDTYGGVAALNRLWGSEFGAIEDAPLTGHGAQPWLRGPQRQDYLRFLDRQPDERLNVLHVGLAFESGDQPSLSEWRYVRAHAGQLRRQFAFRNYVNVWDELAGEGRALWNTVVYCTLSIALALLVNPLAAYGLSRFRLRGGYKALLILMATMAFPPMVTLIPQFIVLRNLGLMNTFVALLLPLIANGYLIFLLKGFFDSLPKELYEAGTIDGASELRMFFQIAMALSKPILAVVALQTFTAAYTMFLYALLVAPDRDMWLISVWLFQYQERASSSGVFASVVIASVPTLALFLLVQRTIMRGIVVPTEK
ncbi:MAG: carbohydrate ABC transporter permease [Planctomycetota bacterium]